MDKLEPEELTWEEEEYGVENNEDNKEKIERIGEKYSKSQEVNKWVGHFKFHDAYFNIHNLYKCHICNSKIRYYIHDHTYLFSNYSDNKIHEDVCDFDNNSDYGVCNNCYKSLCPNCVCGCPDVLNSDDEQ